MSITADPTERYGDRVTQVEPELIADALGALGVTEIKPLQPGAQKAVHLVDRDGVTLVLKVITLGASTPDALRRAEREVELLASLNSPHVVEVKSHLVELGTPVRGAAWLEEYLDGDDLTKTLTTHEWTWTDTARMARQVAKGLGVAHAKKVVHRDLSSNNVRRLADGSFKVMDFGFARHTLRSGLTVAGQPGTPGFASPEHMHGFSGGPTAASDVFAVGILMYAALSGSLPIPHLGDDADYARRLHDVSISDLASVRTGLSEENYGIVRRCLHRQPARRFLNGAHLAAALEGM